MTSPSNKSRGHFRSLKLSCFSSMDEANTRFRAARRAGNEADARAFFNDFNRLSDELDNIRIAEIAFRSSPLNDSDADARLLKAVGEAKGALKRMKKVGEALNGLADAINLFGRLINLF